jgi:Amt family ammonium transporter
VDESSYHEVFFHWAFAATAATTVSGCMAERTQAGGYFIYSFVITAFIYAIPLHWVWADAGWLCAWGEHALFGVGMIDFAGSGIVHMLGGVAGMVGSFVVGPRAGRFAKEVDQSKFGGSSLALSTLGVYCLWFGWFGFNAGCTFGVSDGGWRTAALVCLNTVLSPAAALIASVCIERMAKGYFDASACMNAVVAGLVGITGPCGVVQPWAAFVIGLVSGAIYSATWRVHEWIKLDDPVHAVAVHAWPGMWGCIAPGFFACSAQVATLGYVAKPGLFYNGDGTQLGAQAVATLVLCAWTVLTSALVFGTLRCCNLLRVPEADEAMGVDVAEYGVRAGAALEAGQRTAGALEQLTLALQRSEVDMAQVMHVLAVSSARGKGGDGVALQACAESCTSSTAAAAAD